jgi:DNA primase
MDAVEDIKQRLSIEDVLSEYVQLKRAGRNFKGLSPFNAEKTPSFIVSPEKQIWHDFSSGRGGDVFTFVMEVEGLDFKGAIELLARKAGIDLDQYQGKTGSNSKLKERLHEVLELAARFYQVQFSKSEKAFTYVMKERGFTKETALKFLLGYSPNNGSALHDFLKKKDFTAEEMQKAGLVTRRGGRLGDMFRGRLMIPLQDPQGRVVGFTARLLDDEPDAPKYINTPQTLLYDKGRHIYGLHLAKEAIRKNKYSVLVEGNLDVIAAHQADTPQVVATAGTALTEMQLKALGKFSGDVRLCFDQDRAGQQAAERAIPIASKVGVSLSMLTLPGDAKDPDELIRHDAKTWQTTLDKPEYALDWLIGRYQKELDLSTAQGVRQFTDVILEVIRQLSDSVEQDHYLAKISQLLGVGIDALRSKLAVSSSRPRLKKRSNVEQSATSDAVTRERLKTEQHLLALCLHQPAVRQYLKSISEDMLTTDDAKRVRQFLDEHPDFAGESDKAKKLKNVAEYVKILGLQFEELYQGLELIELRDEAARLQTRLIEQYVKSQKQMLRTQLEAADEKEQSRLLGQVKKLDDLLKR